MTTTDDEETQLMIRYQEGEIDAFDRLYRKTSPKVYGFLLNKLKNPEWAQEVLQDVFLKLHRSRRLFKSKYGFRSWIFSIARNSANDFFRKKVKTPEEVHPDLDQFAFPEVATIERTTEEKLNLSALSEAQQTLLKMRYTEELDFDEIAKRLNTSAANIRQRISRTLRELRAYLGTP